MDDERKVNHVDDESTMLTRYHYHVPTLKNQTSHMLLQIIQQTADFKTQTSTKQSLTLQPKP